jgi:hypothetical protein
MRVTRRKLSPRRAAAILTELPAIAQLTRHCTTSPSLALPLLNGLGYRVHPRSIEVEHEKSP